MVGMRMRKKQEWDVADAETAQAGVDGVWLEARVDDYRASRRYREHERVALPDVAGDDVPPVRRPGRRYRPYAQQDNRGRDDHGDEEPRPPYEHRREHDDDDRGRRQRQRTARVPRPVDSRVRPVREPSPDPADPPRGKAGDSRDKLGERWGDRRDHRDDDAQNGRWGDRRGGEQVRRDRDEAHLLREHDDDGRADELGRHRHGERRGE